MGHMGNDEYPHRRYNPLTDEWVKVSPHRTKRPWQGKTEEPDLGENPAYDPECYLCPGNKRAGGKINPEYTGTFVFDNDFAALLPDAPPDIPTDNEAGDSGGGSAIGAGVEASGNLFRSLPERGLCRVMCFSPRHNVTLARMSELEIGTVVRAWKKEYETIGALDYISHVQIFENRGEIMGCSNPHPHCQVWAEETIPDLPAREAVRQKLYSEVHGSVMLLDYIRAELRSGERIVAENSDFAAVVPFWAVWPFETLVVPRFALDSLSSLNDSRIAGLSDILRRMGIKYDNLFKTSFPYSMGIHQLPTDGRLYPGLQMHIHYFPPLLRSASVRKFMVGYEMLAMPQRDLTPEQAAARLREQPEKHYADLLSEGVCS